jgi:hypothetical protein
VDLHRALQLERDGKEQLAEAVPRVPDRAHAALVPRPSRPSGRWFACGRRGGTRWWRSTARCRRTPRSICAQGAGPGEPGAPARAARARGRPGLGFVWAQLGLAFLDRKANATSRRASICSRRSDLARVPGGAARPAEVEETLGNYERRARSLSHST